MRARPPSLNIHQDNTLSPDSSSPTRRSRPHTSPGPGSLTPSPRRERAPLRSSPLAGPSYASDGAGGIVQHSSALDEEIARRHLSVEPDAERARSASPNSPSVSVEGFSALSRQNSTSDSCGESAGHGGGKRRARPSFISLAPPGSPSHSAGATQLSPPPSLRSRHSSPNIARAASLDVPSPLLPTTPTVDSSANWMTSTPTPSFSRTAIHSKGVVLPIKADSKSAQRIRRKSMSGAPSSSRHSSQPGIVPVPELPESHPTKHDQDQAEITEPRGQSQSIRPKKSTRSLRSVRSLGRMFRHEHQQDDKDAPPLLVPPLPTPSLSRASSIGSGMSVQLLPTPPDNAALVSSPDPASAPEATMDSPSTPVIEETREGKIKKLWAKVTRGVKKVK
ncbi:hypothetical protein FRC08_006488 [Ceratobasidium sp. 394]|nr:hypothetical protein FRC08_006488 [Ceratobasidium sp. 394]